jgi:hypothetical protein
MKKALALILVAAITFTAFAGTAQATWWLKYRLNYNTGWVDHGMIGNYHVIGKIHEVDNAMWMENQGVVYMPGHETWQVNYDVKCLDGNKPITLTHYNRHYNVVTVGPRDSSGYKQFKSDQGPLGAPWYFVRYVDPKASDLPFVGNGQQAWFWYGALSLRDTASLNDIIFTMIPLEDIPLIYDITITDSAGNVILYLH